MAAPVASVTVPEMLPFITPCWPETKVQDTAKNKNAATQRRNETIETLI